MIQLVLRGTPDPRTSCPRGTCGPRTSSLGGLLVLGPRVRGTILGGNFLSCDRATFSSLLKFCEMFLLAMNDDWLASVCISACPRWLLIKYVVAVNKILLEDTLN